MSPELLHAIKERIQLGYSKKEIENELIAAGYDLETIDRVYDEAQSHSHPTASVEVPPVEEGGETTSTEHTTVGHFIGYGELISRSWELFTARISLFAKAFLVNVLTFSIAGAVLIAVVIGSLGSFGATGFEGFLEEGPDMTGTGLATLGVVLLLLFVAVVVVSMSVFGATIRNLLASEPEGFIDSWKWVFRENRVISLIIIALFTYLANQTGYLLLFIPGIAMAVYFMFSSYVMIDEDVRGLSAMVRSTEIVYGRWWGVVGRLLVTGLVVGVILFGMVIASGLLFGGLSVMAGGWALGIVIALLYGAVMFVAGSFMTAILTTLYRSLKHSTPTPAFSDERKAKLKMWFRVAVIVGPIAVIILQGFGNEMEGMDSSESDLNTVQAAIVSQQLSNAVAQAELYYNDGGFSYFGVCSDLEALVSAADSLSCNDAIESWAMTATLGGDMWCADSTGFNKRIQNPLEDRTQCLDLPSPSDSSAFSQ